MLYNVRVTSRTGTRERILSVSKGLFAKRGYEHTSTSAIAREAGTSESQLMKHFGSKAGLLEAIFTESWSRITEQAKEATRDVPVREKLGAVSALVVESLERDADLKLLMLLEGRRIRKEGQMVVLTEGFMNFVQLLDSILEDMKADGHLRPGLNPQAVRSALMGMLEGMMRDRFLAEKTGYPGGFEGPQIEVMLTITLAACLKPASAGAGQGD